MTLGFQPVRTVEFHWYACEEVGLVGSADLATLYREQNTQVYAMMEVGVRTTPSQAARAARGAHARRAYGPDGGVKHSLTW